MGWSGQKTPGVEYASVRASQKNQAEMEEGAATQRDAATNKKTPKNAPRVARRTAHLRRL
jgi:hypothetical protein